MSIDDTHKTRADDHLATLLPQAARQIGELAREEVRLAGAELAAHRRDLGFGGGLLGAAGLMGFIAVQAFAAAVIAALAVAMPVWLAALLVGVAAALAASVAAFLGKKQVARVAPAVEEAVGSVKADVAAIKDGGR
jgi:hypothetical protein